MTTPEMETEVPPTAENPAETPVETPVEPASDAPVGEPPAGSEPPAGDENGEEDEATQRKRRLLLLLLLLLLLICCCLSYFILRYFMKPQSIPQLLPTQVAFCQEPVYKSAINNVDGPISIAVSPDDQRIYVAESGGERLVKVFDRDGNLLNKFGPPGTDKANREPKYMAIDANGRVYLADRTSSAIDIYDADGRFIDAIIGQHMTLSKYLALNIKGGLPAGGEFLHYEGINKVLTYKLPDGKVEDIKIAFPADEPQWSPLGLRFDAEGNLVYTDTTETLHTVNIIPAASLQGNLSVYNPQIKSFGSQGSAKDQFDFPQTVVLDGKDNFYISDGNNARIDVWTPDMQYKTFFGFGSSVNGALNLPRGTWMAPRNCLYVADAVGSLIRVYNLSGAEPALAFELGGFGIEEGQFNYPTDVVIDGTGRLYVTDRANNRIQIWSY